ncbi:hypothetical protein NQ318_011199 [Aromia moschata]|uniref:Uncharacterized protein n=1 Tax=Aromia moschata TaxID=1265417 RepID=A0AAV8X3K8_9CUCU|nr:hypothetical protein NQ318_011199 [Aromia moschata]
MPVKKTGSESENEKKMLMSLRLVMHWTSLQLILKNWLILVLFLGHQVEKHYMGKNKTKWAKEPGPRNVRTRAENLVTAILPRIKRCARDAKTPIDCFYLRFDDRMLNYIKVD